MLSSPFTSLCTHEDESLSLLFAVVPGVPNAKRVQLMATGSCPFLSHSRSTGRRDIGTCKSSLLCCALCHLLHHCEQTSQDQNCRPFERFLLGIPWQSLLIPFGDQGQGFLWILVPLSMCFPESGGSPILPWVLISTHPSSY